MRSEGGNARQSWSPFYRKSPNTEFRCRSSAKFSESQANYQLMGLQQAAFERKAVLDQQAKEGAEMRGERGSLPWPSCFGGKGSASNAGVRAETGRR